MVCYLDASLILAIVFGEDYSDISWKIWQECYIKLSSLICEAECYIVIRRYYENNKKKLSQQWLEKKEKYLSALFNEVHKMKFDENILNIIKKTMHLSNCRTLDAIHIATALEFKKNCDEAFYLCTFDNNMIKAAKGLDLLVKP